VSVLWLEASPAVSPSMFLDPATQPAVSILVRLCLSRSQHFRSSSVTFAWQTTKYKPTAASLWISFTFLFDMHQFVLKSTFRLISQLISLFLIHICITNFHHHHSVHALSPSSTLSILRSKLFTKVTRHRMQVLVHFRLMMSRITRLYIEFSSSSAFLVFFLFAN